MTNKTTMTGRLSALGGKKQLIAIAVLIALGVIGAAAILGTEGRKTTSDAHGHDDHGHGKSADPHGHGHDDDHADGDHHDESPKGPHGGEMQADGDHSFEILLAEDAGEPRLKLWMYRENKPLSLAGVKVTAEFDRPSGAKEQLKFAIVKDALVSTEALAEPHAFEGTITIIAREESFLLPFSRSEGLIELSEAQMKAAGVAVDTAGPATIKSALQLAGEIRFNEDRTAHVVPRVSGVVESVPAAIGQAVRKGQVLAVLSSPAISDQRAELQASNKRLDLARVTYDREKKLWEEKISPHQDVLEAERALREAEIASTNALQKLQALGAGAGGPLNRYELRAPFDGIIVEKDISMGEQVKDDAHVFTISDLRTVWAQTSVPAKDLHRLRLGERVTVRSTASDQTASGKVAYVGSLLGEQTRAAVARVELPNPQTAWRPGLFVNVELVTNDVESPVTVTSDAIQSIDGKTVVFLRVPNGFIPQPVQVGGSDSKRVEILKGLPAGSRYVSSGSFMLKAEAGKASATHSH